MSDRKGVKNVEKNKAKYNASGCKDLTAYNAMLNIEREEALKKLLATIFYLCDLAGFHIEERIVIRDKKTNKIWR